MGATESSRHVQDGLSSFSSDYVLSGDDGFDYDAGADSDDNIINDGINSDTDDTFSRAFTSSQASRNLPMIQEKSQCATSGSQLAPVDPPTPVDFLAVTNKMPDLSLYSMEQLHRICEKYGLKQEGSRTKLEKILSNLWERIHATSQGGTQDTVDNVGEVRVKLEGSNTSQDRSTMSSRNIVLSFIRNHTRIYEDVLTFVPLDINVVHAELKANDARISKSELQRILDEEGVFSSSIGNKRKAIE